MSRVHIREFKVQDATNVSSLIRRTMKISNSSDYPIERLEPLMDYFSPVKILQLCEERSCFVAEFGEGKQKALIGTAAIEADELLTFFVNPDFQRRGIGTKLLEAVEAVARANHLTSLNCEASLTAVSFYLKNGFIRTGVVKDGTAGQQIGMIKSLVN